MRICLAWSLALLMVAAGTAHAQQRGAAVQLPTYSFFSTNTTVTVPDRGMAYLGGVNRAASGRNEFGVPMLPFRPFRNIGIGREVSSSGMWVTATIHDFEAMDRFLLGESAAAGPGSLPPARGLVASPATTRAAFARTPMPRRPAHGASWRLSSPAGAGNPPKMSVAQARAERYRQQTARAQEATEFFQRGQTAEEAGKTGVAKIYYQMAARRANGELKGQIAARLESIDRAQTASNLAQTRP